MSGVRVEIPTGRFQRFVAEDALQNMQWDSCIGKPRRTCVTETMPGEVGQAEFSNEGVPFGSVTNSCCGENSATWSSDKSLVGFAAGGEAFEDWGEVLQYRDMPDLPALGLLCDKAAGAWECLAADRDDSLFPVDVTDLESRNFGPSGSK